MMDNIEDIFGNKDLFLQALTHKSWVNEHSGVRSSNERLEFLGDAVLEFVVSSHLYEKFPDKEEGFLTALRANLVNTVNLSQVAKSLDLGKKIFLSKGEEEGGGRENSSILADTVEAVIGAVYLDAGLDAAAKFIQENIFNGLEEKLREPLKDPKSMLQEMVQSHGIAAPRYEVVKEEGPDHAKTFTVEVKFDSKTQGVGSGKNKSEAEQEAAKNALSSFAGK
jgi:ribonuclease III